MAALATAEEREATAALATASADLLQVMVQTAGGVGHLEAINLIVVCLPAFIVTRFLDRRITKSTCQANFRFLHKGVVRSVRLKPESQWNMKYEEQAILTLGNNFDRNTIPTQTRLRDQS